MTANVERVFQAAQQLSPTEQLELIQIIPHDALPLAWTTFDFAPFRLNSSTKEALCLHDVLLGLTLCSLLVLATRLPVSAQDAAQPSTPLKVEGDAYTISLPPSGQTILAAVAPTAGAASTTWGGSWSQAEGTIYVRLNATGNGAALKKAVQIEGVVADGGFDVQGLGVDNLVYDREDLDLTLGSGQRHPFVRTINQLAAAIPYLNYYYSARFGARVAN